jgi:hypothetical protein
VVARRVTALAEGMQEFLRGAVAPAEFIPDVYNGVAMQQFCRAIGAEVT